VDIFSFYEEKAARRKVQWVVSGSRTAESACALQKVQCGGPSDHLKVSLRQLAYALAWKHSACQEPGFRCRCAVISHQE